MADFPLRYYDDVYQERTNRDIEPHDALKRIWISRFELGVTTHYKYYILSLLWAYVYLDKLETPRVRHRDFFPR